MKKAAPFSGRLNASLCLSFGQLNPLLNPFALPGETVRKSKNPETRINTGFPGGAAGQIRTADLILTNDDLSDADDCLIVKDSYGDPFSIYLSQHYHRVIVLDYRKNEIPVSRVAEEYGVADVILCQHISVSQTRKAQYALENLMR